MNDLIHRNGRRLILGIALIICSAVIPTPSSAAEVNVYAEGAYTGADLVLHIYADITSGAILSFGVKVTYPAAELTYASATKNEAVWYMGNGTTPYAYMNPEDDGSNVVIIGGKLDTADPAAGVTGTRVLLGTVTFTHGGATDFSGVTLTYGRGDGSGAYKNFVGTDGTVIDGDVAGFSVEIHERGDANGNGDISTADYVVIRNNLGRSDAPPWMDCNADGTVSTADYVCVRNKIQ